MHISRTHRLFSVTSLAGVIAAVALAQPAAAATQRFASTNGSGTTCTAASPCDLYTAVSQASASDDVSVAPGDYTLSNTLTDPADITIHGAAGKPRPRIRFIGSTQAGINIANGSTLRNLEIDQQYPDRLAIDSVYAVLDQLVVRDPGGAPCSMSIFDGTVSNSIVVAADTAICSDVDNAANTSSLRNVTAVSTDANSTAISVFARGAGGISNLILTNVIAQGGPNGWGLTAQTDGSGAYALISNNHDNYVGARMLGTNAHVAGGTGDQVKSPTFVNAAGGDYHQAAGSVTIDAGITQQANGPQDVDGDQRTLGSSTDIGADEFVPPAPPAQPGQPGQPGTPGTPGTPTTSGTSTSSTGSSTPTIPRSPFAGVKLLSTRLSFARHAIVVTLRCPKGTAGRCSGQTKLTTRVRIKHSRRTATIVLGRATFSIAPGAQRKITVQVSRAGRRLFARVRRMSGNATNAARNGAGQSKTTVASVTIRPVAKRSRH